MKNLWEFKNDTLTISNELIRIPNIKFINVIGQGANAVCFKCKKDIPERIVAVKIWLSRRGYKYPDKKRFMAEINKLAKFNSEKIVQIYNAGFIGKHCFAEMEYIEGITLYEWMKTERTLLDRVYMLDCILKAVKISHDNKIYHGDLHEKNIMILNKDNDKYDVKLLDFGTSIFSKSKADSYLRENKILLNTCLNLLKKEKIINLIDINVNEVNPETTRKIIENLSLLTWMLEFYEEIFKGMRDTMDIAMTRVTSTPFFNLTNLYETLISYNVDEAKIKKLFNLIFEKCNTEITDKKYKKMINCNSLEDKIKKTEQIYKEYRRRYVTKVNRDSSGVY